MAEDGWTADDCERASEEGILANCDMIIADNCNLTFEEGCSTAVDGDT